MRLKESLNSLPKLNLEADTVRSLDEWNIKKGIFTTTNPSYLQKINSKLQADLKETHASTPKGFIGKQAITLEKIKKFQHSSRKLLPITKINKEGSNLSFHTLDSSITIKSESLKNSTNKSLLKIDSEREESEFAKTISKNIDFENEVNLKYMNILSFIQQKKEKQYLIQAQKDIIHQKILHIRLENAEQKINANKEKNCFSPSGRKSSISKQIKCNTPKHSGTIIINETKNSSTIENSNLLIDLTKQYNDLQNVANSLEEKILQLKIEAAKEKNRLSEHYHSILNKGVDIRQEGLIWVLKAICEIKEIIKVSKMPNYLDETAIKFLLRV